MVGSTLMDARLVIEVSEPWELAREKDDPPLGADVKDVRGDPYAGRSGLLLELTEPLEFDGETYERLVAHIEGESPVQGLGEGAAVEASLYGVPSHVEIIDPLDVGWWRGGLGMLGSLRRA